MVRRPRARLHHHRHRHRHRERRLLPDLHRPRRLRAHRRARPGHLRRAGARLHFLQVLSGACWAGGEPPARPFAAPAGTVLFRPGDSCPGFVLLRRGSIRVDLVTADGHSLLLYRVGPGGSCALSVACLFSDEPHSAEGVVEAAAEGALLIPAAFRRLVDEDAGFRARVLEAFGARLADVIRRIEELSFRPVDAWLAALLLRRGPELPATHDAIAAEIGSAREVVSRRLGVLARAGHVALARGVVRVLDRAALARIAASP
ncbi:MAG: Crp/Fnr family transcriptional regulator [Acetobacteraceae bacterium]|nr:Crp/Fnr family transcriptional regulator [Acetobacteraceae bacterium]